MAKFKAGSLAHYRPAGKKQYIQSLVNDWDEYIIPARKTNRRTNLSPEEYVAHWLDKRSKSWKNNCKAPKQWAKHCPSISRNEYRLKRDVEWAVGKDDRFAEELYSFLQKA